MNLYQLSTIIIMDKAKVGKYSKLTIVYFIGVAVIVYGLYTFLTVTGGDSTSNSFYMMFSGLVVATAGSIYGHNKVAGPGIKNGGPGPAKPEQDKKPQAKEEKKEKMDDRIAKAMAENKDSAKRLEELKKLEKQEAKRLEDLRKEEEKEMKRLEEERKKEEERLAKEAMEEAKEAEAKSASAPAKAKAPSGGVVKIIICPSCGEENKYTAKFCDNCGKKMRP
jgi:type IV secretory pathway VirB10-like protein